MFLQSDSLDYFINEEEIRDNKKIKEICRSLNDEDIKKIINFETHIDQDKINIKEVYKDYYHLTTNLKSYTTTDDVYTNGMILETKKGKIIKDFSVAIIVKRNNDFSISEFDLIMCGKNDDEITDIKEKMLPVYLSRNVLNLFI